VNIAQYPITKYQYRSNPSSVGRLCLKVSGCTSFLSACHS